MYAGCGDSQNITKVNIFQSGYKAQSLGKLDPLYEKQWYLYEQFGINITPVWKEYLGDGVSIAVVDSGIEASHPDLVENIDLVRSLRYVDGSSDPTPTSAELSDSSVDGSHGTAVAGIISASHNDIGIIGIAPNATLVGLNVFSRPDDSAFEDAMKQDVDISSNSWGIDLSTNLVDDRVVLEAIISKMLSKPTIYTFAAGNDGSNSGFSSVLNSRYTLVVGASTREGKIARYSNHGTNVLCVAPGGESQKIVTTDLIGNSYGYDVDGDHFDIFENQNYEYSDYFSGTSAAVPMVSAVVALMLEANPNLGYRDVRYILEHTSRQIDKTDDSWMQNGAGLWVSNYFGYGLVDAQKAVDMAKTFKTLPSEIKIQKEIKKANISIPDDDSKSVELVFDIDEDIVIEHVSLQVSTQHSQNGDLKIKLISPSKTEAILSDGDTQIKDDFSPWEFGVLSFVDEKSQGIWKLQVSDLQQGHIGDLKSAKLTIHGHKR
jgi:subtilisin family serine protease/subtilisin-like proprotein convertase family protein